MRRIFRELDSYRKIIFNLNWTENKEKMDYIEKILSQLNKTIMEEGNIRFNHEILDTQSIPEGFNCVIIDIEGDNPLKLMGILLRNNIFSYGLKEKTEHEFFDCLFKVLKLVKDLIIFAFSFWDFNMIIKIQKTLKENYGYSDSQLKSIDSILNNYFNLQEYDKESVVSALYSFGIKESEVPRDPLYRKSFLINQLYSDGFYNIIQEHNRSCLQAELMLLKRYIRKNLIPFTKVTNYN